MGRSKFPGKPSKHVNRTRINVLSTVVNTTVVGDCDPNVVTVREGDDSNKHEGQTGPANTVDQDEKPVDKQIFTRSHTKKVNINKKLLPLKRTVLLGNNSNGHNSSSRLTRSKVTRRSVRGFSNIRKLNKPKLVKSPKKETGGIVGKFVLPSRSVHSSRVIKPNKRFISVEQSETRIVKKRIINKKVFVKPEEDQAAGNSVDVSEDDNKTKIEDVAENNECKPAETSFSENGGSIAGNGKVVLRQARLQISSKIPVGPEGPFSTKSITGSPGTMKCGVCGAVRIYRILKQARKFNIYSCESCRKFITKMIAHANNKNLNTPLVCLKGQGSCPIGPIVRSQQWKLKKITNNLRCSACWLKLCLRSFQLPLTLKTSLSQFLPKNMQTNDSLFKSTLPFLSWQSGIENKIQMPPPTNLAENKEITLRQRPVRLKSTKKEEKPVPPPVINDIKRQKIDLKGPRVKHVCRSASIVLGQPIATFSADKKEVPLEKDKEKEKEKCVEIKVVEKCKTEVENVAMKVTVCVDSKVEAVEECVKAKEEEIIKAESKEVKVQNIATKKERNKQVTAISTLPLDIIKPSFNKKTKKIPTPLETANLVDIDYWEPYDPDEIVCGGFSIIASEDLPMQSICFLCGSAGKESLLYCCICCEPYHPYCLEQGPPNFTNPEQKYTWICPKCTTCSACGVADRQKINCQKCHKSYHPPCFNTKWRTDDRPTVCSNCLRCKSCGTDNITKFVGNLALCLICFKLRNKGNFCPLCQCCYDDNDFDTKMMECAKCNKWVHAKCEGVSDEHYQILSILPESVEFICCLCSSRTTPHWRKAVQTELHSCFNNILRLLSKNKIARDMLKLSPFKPLTPNFKQLSSARRLQFFDDENRSKSDSDNSLENDLERVSAIFKNKIDFEESFKASALNDSKVSISPTMVEIKSKLNCNEYFSLRDFNEGMELALKSTNSHQELLTIYRSILKKVFPWFDPNQKEDLDRSICDISRAEKNEEEKKYSYEVFDVLVSDKVDERMCNLCKGIGDGSSSKESRLLYCGQNEWVHANCALWSSEVYEEIDGSLQNVHSAISRGRSIRCSHCKQRGATVGCCLKGCSETYHFPCALKASCTFIVDRTIYCKSHELNPNLVILSNPREYEIRRSVYIEVEGRKKKLCEPEKVNFMVGSLSVINLGSIIPSLSDTVDAIIPIGYVCSKLFWSTTEPWKLIPYKITTAISNSQSQILIDKNFTVDHTLPKHIVEKKLKEIYLWQRDDKERDLVEFEDYEEPQTTADILSPELTDAILQELPHDLLDGISVQDMLMGYEELMNLDFKTTEINCNDNLSLNMNNETKSDDSDDSKNVKELKRSKSEVFQRIEDKIKPRNQQRSCSLTWLQLDNTLSPAIKKRKIASSRDNMFMQLLQVDGACDSSSSECGSPTHESECTWTMEPYEEPVTCEKCRCTYRTNASYKRHLESCDAMFTSESETETETLVVNVSENPEPQFMASYETYSSFQATQNQIQSTVMNTQTILSESTKLQENNGVFYNYQSVKPIMTPQQGVINLNEQAITENNQILNQYCVNPQNVCVNQSNLISMNKGQIALNPSIISIDNTQVINQINPMNGLMDIQQPQVALQSVPYTQDISPIINLNQQNQAITIDAKMLQPTVVNSVMNIPQNQWVRPIMPQTKPRSRPRIVAKQPKIPSNAIMLPQNTSPVILQHIPSTNMLPFVDTFQQQSSQNVQYVATIAPQMNSSITPQTQLVQIPENNYISLVPNVQPTMIIQQPRVDTGQLIVDSNGSMVWATQPVYYGFETIVQNTVMQSQQFLPTTMPGVLTANSSYSATTQVFQTSKLEPVIDGSFVLVNSNPIVNQPTVQVPQIASHPIQNNLQIQAKRCYPTSQPQSQPIPQPQPIKPVQVVATTTNNTTTNSITLPVAPFVPEQGIPTNIVTPTPKPPTSNQYRPMSRVLPMQTTTSHQKKHEKIVVNKEETEKIVVDTQKITILGDVVVKQCKEIKPCVEAAVNNSVEIIKPSNETPPVISRIDSKLKPANDILLSTRKSNSIKQPKGSNIPKPSNTIIVSNDLVKQCNEIVNKQCSDLIAKQKHLALKHDLIVMQCNDLINKQSNESRLNKCKEVYVEKECIREKEKILPESAFAKFTTKNVPEVVETPLVEVVPTPNKKEEEVAKPSVPIANPPEAAKDTKVLKTKIEMREQKEEIKKLVEKEVLKVNKIQIAQLKPIKPKQVLGPLDKENNVDVDVKVVNMEEPYKPPPKSVKRANQNTIYYKVESSDGFDFTAPSLPQIWRKVFNDVQAARLSHNLPPLPDGALKTLNDLDIMGLKSKGMKYLLEQLPEINKCTNYKPVFHKPSVEKMKFEEEEDDEGTRRCLPFDTKKEKYDMFGWLCSKHRTLEMYDLDANLKRSTSSSLPMAMRFRTLKVMSKFSVGVYRSDIHGRGLFSLRDIEAGEMVIEYAGEVIRSVLTDTREKYYNSKGIGCYMFRIDDNLVVDATMRGNAARFINHSCDPNCYSKVVEILGHKHIIIFALRKIICGEELTYDYKFPFEEDKIPCTCGTKRCRKFLN